MEVSGEKQHHQPLPLHTYQVDPYVRLNRVHAAIYASSILALFYHHFLHLVSTSSSSHTVLSTCLSLCLCLSDAVLAFMWVVTQAFRWRPIRRRAFPERIQDKDLPRLDVFICTADPRKEPPMVTVNTVLSVMAFEYPTEKLSVYVSDDGGSELTLFAIMEAARFARHWLPFCRDNDVDGSCCSPEAYFRTRDVVHNEEVKILYQRMKERILAATEKGRVDHDLLVSEKERSAFDKWTGAGFTRCQHPSVVQVLLESRKDEDVGHRPMPNLVYVSREKATSCPHHFKAGALNALLRVSSVMTDAPVLLTLDCDAFSNDRGSPRRALCFLLDDAGDKRTAYVQFPQRFLGTNDGGDVYGSEFKRLFQIEPPGMDGFNGPNYVGSGAFFRRCALHGEVPSTLGSPDRGQEGCDDDNNNTISSVEVVGRAHMVAGATYEQGTKWGSTVGFRYGSLVEDYHTGYGLHCEGWKSVYYDPDRPAFLGDVPTTLEEVLNQVKRWCVGLLEVGFSHHCPLSYGVERASLPMAMCYSKYAFWPTWSIPVMFYGIIPQMALAHQLPLINFPKLSDPWILLYLYLALASYAQNLLDFIRSGGSMGSWWNNQRMWLIKGVTCYPLAILEYTSKHMGQVPSVGFNVTNKGGEDDERRKRFEKGVFDFGVESPFMVSIGVFAMANLASFAVGLTRTARNGRIGDFALHLLLSGFVVVNCWPIYEAMMFRRDDGRMPLRCVKLSVVLTGLLHFALGSCFNT